MKDAIRRALIPVLGVCAERNAMNHAIIHGETDFLAVAVVSDLYAPLFCRAGLACNHTSSPELSDNDILIIAQGRSGDRIITSVDELFKGGFPPDTTAREIQESFRWSAD